MKKIGLYCGTFDPIHFGHINLALEIFENGGFDKIFFCPANIPPNKINNPPKASPEDRLKMVEIALKELPFFEVCDFEVERGGVSYTIDTVKSLKKKYGDELRLIVATDFLDGFSLWKDYEEILKLAPPVIGVRKGYDRRLAEKSAFYKDIVETKILEISSTDIRRRLKEKLYCFHLLPVKVLDYIYKHDLY